MPGKDFILIGALLCLVCGQPPSSPGQEKGKPAASPERESLTRFKLQGKQSYYSSTTWEVLPPSDSPKGAVCVTVFRLGKDPESQRPVLLTIARQTDPGVQGGSSRINEKIKFAVPIGNSTFIDYQFKEGEHAFDPEIEGRKFELSKGKVFVIDFGEKPPQIKQVKADLDKVFKKHGTTLTRKDMAAALQTLRAADAQVESFLKQLEGK